MANVWHLFVNDLKRLSKNTVTIIAVLGLVILPSLFSWYNLLACWDVFDNTGNLKVAVANTDAGYKSDLAPIEVNIGERVVAALRANDQLNFVITDEADAIDGARSGRYYAAVVIPETFSRDMMSFYSSDAEHAQITYYSNEKKSAIAPKVTDQGADKISQQVNQVFAETLSEVALGISSAIVDYVEDADAGGELAELSNHLNRMGTQLSDAASTLGLYSDVVNSSQQLIRDSGSLLAHAQSSASNVVGTAAEARESGERIGSALEDAVASLDLAVDRSVAGFEGVPESIDTTFASVNTLANDSAGQLRNRGAAVEALIVAFEDLASQVEGVRASVPEDDQARVDSLVSQLNSSIAQLEQLRDGLEAAADDIDAGVSDAADTHDEVSELAEQTKATVADARTDYEENVKPQLNDLADLISDAGASVSSTGAAIDAASGDLVYTANELADRLDNAKDKISKMQDTLNDSATRLNTLGANISKALDSGDKELIRDVLSEDPQTLAAALSAPVKVERHAIHPVENFGSAMSPLYTTLALWIGALLTMVMLKVQPSSRTLEELDNPTNRQVFCGRFGIVALISLAQSTTLSLGNLLFLGVQANNPFLYLLCFWVAGLVFSFIIYTMVSLFANFGKALGVILLIVQVSGGGGSFPMQLLPQFFQDLNPYLPIAHAVNAMRAAMFGVTNGDFWIEIGTLALFAAPLALIGLVLYDPLIRVVPKLVERIERSKVM